MTRKRYAAVVAILLCSAAAVFVVGTRIEVSGERSEHSSSAMATSPRSDKSPPPSSVPSPMHPGTERSETGEGENGEATGPQTDSGMPPNAHVSGVVGEKTAAVSSPERSRESFLGIEPDSTPAVASAVVATLVVAALVVAFPSVPMLFIVALVSLGFGVLDIREVLHQVSRASWPLTATAAAVAALHIAAALVCVVAARRELRGANA